MTFDTSIASLRQESQSLAERCQRLEANPLLTQFALRLRLVSGEKPDASRERPVVVAIVGGTGAGKSQLFNALIDRDEASPTSTGKRLKTKHPVVARLPAEHALLPDLGDARADYVDTTLTRIALVDTPDLDGMLREHREIAERVIAAADLIVLVTCPERYSDQAVLTTVCEWAHRKRWYFVANQTDRGEGTLEEKRDAFDQRLIELGFVPNDSCRFMVSAISPDQWDFGRLRSTLLQERSRETTEALLVDTVIGQIVHACNPSVERSIGKLIAELATKEGELGIRIILRVKEGIDRRQLRDRLRPVLRRRTWAALRGRGPLLLAIPVAIHARFSVMASGFQLWRLTTAGVSLWRLGLLATTLFHSLRGGAEVRTILSEIDHRLAPELDAIRTEARLFLEDRDLAALPDAPVDRLDEDLQQAVANIPMVGKSIGRVASLLVERGKTGRVASELAPLLNDAIEVRAEAVAAGAVGWLATICNVFPAAVLGHACYLLIAAWLRGDWLPGAFYLHAIALFTLSLLPGYFLIHLGVSRQLRAHDSIDTIVGSATRLPPCGPVQVLALLRADLESIHGSLSHLRRRAMNLRAAISAEFGTESMGASARSSEDRRNGES